ncbi:MAG: hypothetical protein JRN20_18780 [Nitrososphaerota archaeon]|nr:hypothetical protein [Nitrososphaerota archaeon]MDG6923896.1 hypothetical protein [Nitrososphaerota archaeon]
MSVSVNGRPFLKVDAESRSVESELAGIKESGIKLSNLVSSQSAGISSLLRRSRSVAKELYDMGWKFALYDKGSNVLSMGRGASRLTAHIHVSLAKLRTIFESL